jgi:hypothetical protein
MRHCALPDYGDRQVGRHCDPVLRLHRVFADAEEDLDAQVRLSALGHYGA